MTLAQVATVKQSSRKIYSDGSGRYRHKRKLYYVFHRCERDLQKEIIRQAKFIDYKFEQFDIEQLISYMLDLFKNDAKKLGIMETDFLYDEAKYFDRGLDYYVEKKIPEKGNFENSIWSHLLNFVDYQKAEDKEELYNKLQNSVANQFAQLIKEEQIYSIPDTFAEFEKIHKIAPFNHYWHGIAQHASEELCTYVVMEMIRQGATLINRENYQAWSVLPDYAEPETYENLYYATILTLYCVYYDQVKDLEKLKVKNEET